MSNDSQKPLAAQREFQFTSADFEWVRRAAFERAGISLGESKHDLVYNRLARRLRALDIESVRDYRAMLADPQAPEWSEFINAITTNVTSFFRESHHFDFLRREVFPILMRTKPRERKIRIWSAGCSSGQEPHSIGIVALETLPLLPVWDVKILATDLDSNMVRTASEGVYSTTELESVPAEYRSRWFRTERSLAPGMFRATDRLRGIITCRRLNLMDPWPMRGPLDFIFCRNVIIYFNRETQQKLAGRYAELLADGGYLFLGHSESLFGSTRFRTVGRTVYQKIA